MAAETPPGRTLGEEAARQLSNTTKTPPQWVGSSPRWLVQLLPWTPVEAGVYRLNRVLEGGFAVECSPDDDANRKVALIDYEKNPREYTLSTVTTTVEVHTRVSDLFRSPMDQVKEQLTVAVEQLKEKQEDELINNGAYGLLNSEPHDTAHLRARSSHSNNTDDSTQDRDSLHAPHGSRAMPRLLTLHGAHSALPQRRRSAGHTRRAMPPAR